MGKWNKKFMRALDGRVFFCQAIECLGLWQAFL